MTTLTLIYAADTAGNFTDPETGNRWDIPEDRGFLRKTVKGKSVICGRKTFEADWPELMEARSICVLTRTGFRDEVPLAYTEAVKRDILLGWSPGPIGVINDSLRRMRSHGVEKEIYCIGGKETIEAFAPFASRVVVTDICMAPESPDDYDDFPRWLPEHIDVELPDISPTHGVWESFPDEVNAYHKLRWRFVEMTRKIPIKL